MVHLSKTHSHSCKSRMVSTCTPQTSSKQGQDMSRPTGVCAVARIQKRSPQILSRQKRQHRNNCAPLNSCLRQQPRATDRFCTAPHHLHSNPAMNMTAPQAAGRPEQCINGTNIYQRCCISTPSDEQRPSRSARSSVCSCCCNC